MRSAYESTTTATTMSELSPIYAKRLQIFTTIQLDELEKAWIFAPYLLVAYYT